MPSRASTKKFFHYVLLLGMPWFALALHAQGLGPGQPTISPQTPAVSSQSALPPATADSHEKERLDDGLQDPAWFGPGITWTRGHGVDLQWARPGAHLDRPLVYLVPWDMPSLPSGKDALDHAMGGQVSEVLQACLRLSLGQPNGVQLARAPEASPYHAVGRVVDATHIREGPQAVLGPLSGWPSVAWDFKVVDTRTGETLLATHHRAVMAGHFAWMKLVTQNLATMAGLAKSDEEAWAMPEEAERLPGGGKFWYQKGLQLEAKAIHLLPWQADTDSDLALWRGWASGIGPAFASSMLPALVQQMAAQGLRPAEPAEAAYLLQGRVFNAPRHLFAQFQAVLLDASTGTVVARFAIPSGFTSNPAPKVAARMVNALLKLQAAPPLGQLAEVAVQPPLTAPPPAMWEEASRLEPGAGALDAFWISPKFSLKGRTLRVGDWLPPLLSPPGDATDQVFANMTTWSAPGWLLGSLLPHQAGRFRVSRTEGELRLEGRVIGISEVNIGKFSTMLAGAFTLGLTNHSYQVFQVRVVEQATGATLLVVQQRVVSFKVASTGTSYKAMKWMAQDFVPWLVQAGLKEEPVHSP
jgi:hypothetical protein